MVRVLCTDDGLYSDKQLQQFPWDPGTILLHRLGGKPSLKERGMLATSHDWAVQWAVGLKPSPDIGWEITYAEHQLRERGINQQLSETKKVPGC